MQGESIIGCSMSKLKENKIYFRRDAKTLVYPFTLSAIDEAAIAVIEFCESNKIDKSQITRVRLSIEESLILWQRQAGPDDKFSIVLSHSLKGPVIKIEAQGPSLDPYTVKESDESNGLGNRLLIELGIVPEYSRRGQVNELTFKLSRKPMNPIAKILCVIAAAIGLGFLMVNILPENVCNNINVGFLTPIYQAFFRMLGAAAGPMIFLSVAWGVYGIGDAVTLGRIGKKLFALFMCVNTVVASLMVLLYGFLGPEFTGTNSGGGGFTAILSMVLDIIPSSMIEPFADGNTLQIIFFAIIIGTCMLFLGQRTSSVAKAIEQINYLVQFLVKFIAKFVPGITFMVILKMVLSGTLSIISESWKLLACVIPAEAICIILVAIWCGMVLQTSPLKLLKKSFPLFLIEITTASSAAGFDSNMRITKDEMGVDPALAAFGVPLGIIICRVGTSVYFPLLCFHFANIYNVDMSWQSVISIVIATVFIGVATPPIPGGGAAAFMALFMQVGIPTEAVATALALDVIVDFIMTTGCQTPIPMLLAVLGKNTGRINMNKLRK